MVLVGFYRVMASKAGSTSVTVVFIRSARRGRMSAVFVVDNSVVGNSITDLNFEVSFEKNAYNSTDDKCQESG